MQKTTWIGLDVHASSVVVAQLSAGGVEAEVAEIPNDPAVIRRKFRKLVREKKLHCCYEAGPCGYELHRLLSGLGIRCDVVAPALIPRRPGDRVKTDRRDAIRLAKALRADELTFVRVPDRAQESARDLLRARDDARRDRTSARHRLTKFLLRRGQRYLAGTNWTQRFWQWIRKQRFDLETDRVVFEGYVDQVRYLDARIEALDQAVRELATSEAFRESVGRLTCLRGISDLSAMVILSELYDLRRFASPRELMAFLGLVPSERSSGGRTRRGGITKTGNGHVRRILVEAAWAYRRPVSITARQRRQLVDQPPEVAATARRANQRLIHRYRQLVGRGKKSPLAVTAVARELCGFVWALGTMDRSRLVS